MSVFNWEHAVGPRVRSCHPRILSTETPFCMHVSMGSSNSKYGGQVKNSFLTACALILFASTAGANVISDGNIQAAERISASTPPRRGPSAVLDYAMVHLAMHDAVQAFERRYEPYCAAMSNVSGSPVAAASKAARDLLVGLFPLQTATIDAAYDASRERTLTHPKTSVKLPSPSLPHVVIWKSFDCFCRPE